MKTFLPLFVSAALLVSLCACGTTETEDPTAATPTTVSEISDEDAASGETAVMQSAPPLSEGAAETSACAGNFFVMDDGQIYTNLAAGDGLIYIPDLPGTDIGYIHVFLPDGDTLYALVRSDAMDLGPAALYSINTVSNEAILLTNDCAAGGSFALAEENLYYMSDGNGLRRINLTDGIISDALPDAETFYGAANGFLYYTKADGGVYRNDSTLGAEFRLLEEYGSLNFFCTDVGLCDVTYDADGTAAVLEFRDTSGNLIAEQPLDAMVQGFCLSGTTVYAVMPGTGLRCFDIADGTEVTPIESEALGSALTLYGVNDEAVWYSSLADGLLSLCRYNLTDGTVTVLADLL